MASRSGDLSQESSFVLSPSRSLSIASQLSYERQRFKSQMEAEHLEWEERIRKAESRAEQSIAAVHKLKSENQQLEMEIEKLQENQNKTELAHLKEKQELKVSFLQRNYESALSLLTMGSGHRVKSIASRRSIVRLS